MKKGTGRFLINDLSPFISSKLEAIALASEMIVCVTKRIVFKPKTIVFKSILRNPLNGTGPA